MKNAKHERLNALIASAAAMRKEIENLRLTANIEFARQLPGFPEKATELKADEWRAIGVADDACNTMLAALSDFRWNRDWEIIYKDIPDFETKRYTRLGFDESNVSLYHRTRSYLDDENS